MTKADHRAVFSLTGPRFLSVEAFALTKDSEPHITWDVSCDEKQSPEGGRTVIATLHSASSDASTTLTVAGEFFWAGNSAQPKTLVRLKTLIAESFALETMYDIARQQAVSMLALLELTIDLPHKSPIAEVDVFDVEAEAIVESDTENYHDSKEDSD